MTEIDVPEGGGNAHGSNESNGMDRDESRGVDGGNGAGTTGVEQITLLDPGHLKRLKYSQVECVPSWCRDLAAELERSTRTTSLEAVQRVLGHTDILAMIADCTALCSKEPTLVDVNLPIDGNVRVSVIGDTHGQYHDVLRLIEVAGEPGEDHMMIFNGDFIDRGAWGLELMTVLMAWKIALPHRVLLVRGNHESVYCAMTYGFFGEMEAKLGPKIARKLFAGFKRMFSNLPLACLVNRATLILHGGLFRKPPAPVKVKGRKRKRMPHPWEEGPVELGTLADLRRAKKGGLDPDGMGTATVATDVLWSDPCRTGGLLVNDSRGVGLLYGPDATAEFLRREGLRLVLRSHEGPDARANREDGMEGMGEGYTIDHVVEGVGKLVTVFSAPDYPQFMDEESRYFNKAAVAVLRPSTSYVEPEFLQFSAVLPRPPARPFYDMDVAGSDEEIDLDQMHNASDVSRGTEAGVSEADAESKPEGAGPGKE